MSVIPIPSPSSSSAASSTATTTSSKGRNSQVSSTRIILNQDVDTSEVALLSTDVPESMRSRSVGRKAHVKQKDSNSTVRSEVTVSRSAIEFKASLSDRMSEEELRNKYFEYWEQEQQRTAPWPVGAGNGPVYASNSHTLPTTAAPAAPVGLASGGSSARSSSDGQLNASSGGSSGGAQHGQRGSQTALLSAAVRADRKGRWPKGKDFLFATWAFVIGAHSLWELPILTLEYGGVVFLIVYLIMFLLIGMPIMLMEMALGQYSALAPTKLYRHLCPILTGVGFAVSLTLLFHCLCDLAVVTWSSQALYLLFSGQAVPENFFYRKVLDVGDSDLSDLGVLHGQLTLCLGIACVVVFVFIAASTKAIGKVSMIIVPLSYGLLMTLTIRACMAEGGPQGILTLLTPDWRHLSQPWIWLSAAKLVFVSMQMGLGVISTFAASNKFHHNIIRDAGIICIGHFIWAILCLLFVFALLGVADNAQRINIDNLRDEAGTELFVTITGSGFWMIGVTLAESAFGTLVQHNWLWSGLLFCLIILATVSTLVAAFEVMASNVVNEFPSLRQYKPAIAFTFVALIFLVNLVFATQGGIHVYYLLTRYYTTWPTLLFGLLTIVAGAFAHGGKYLMKDLGDMSKMSLTHYVSAHLSVLYSTVLPAILSATLAWSLYQVSLEHLDLPLVNFSMKLPDNWGMPLGWALGVVPVFIILLGIGYHIVWQSKGMPFSMHLRRSFKPTDTWYENEHRELMLLDTSPKDSPILAYKRGLTNGFANKNITEV